MNNKSTTYETLGEILLRKEEVQRQLHDSGERIAQMAHEMFVPERNSSHGEVVAKVIANSITAIDAFLLFRKLSKKYGSLFSRKKRR